MNATEMRRVAMNASRSMAEKWWNEYKQELFKEIENTAKSGVFRLSIGIEDKLNKDQLLTDNPLIRAKAEQELQELGFHTEFYGGSYQSDGMDKSFIISWC